MLPAPCLTRPRRCLPLAIGLSALVALPLHGHIPTFGVGTVSRLIFQRQKILITFDLSYASFWAQGEMILADSDKSSSIEEGEASVYLGKQWAEKISPRLRARVDGMEVPFKLTSQRHENMLGEIYGVPFSLYYELEVPLPPIDATASPSRLFELEDWVVRNETPARPRYSIPLLGHGSNDKEKLVAEYLEPQQSPLPDPMTLSYELEGPRLAMKFRLDDGGGSMPPEVGATLPPPPAAQPAVELRDREARESDFFGAALRQDLGWLECLFWLLVAIAYGAAHALAPGHGKSMVAAYLIGTRGRVRDAVLLGLFTTLAHTGSVFLFGVGIFLITMTGSQVSQGHLNNLVIVATKLISGGLLVVLGLTLFLRRSRELRRELRQGSGATAWHAGHDRSHDDGHAHDHGHTHDHGHGHSHAHVQGLLQGGAPRLWDLIALGVSGGIVPCPAALTVILVSLQYTDKLFFALLLLISFSVGLGSVLVAMGVFLVTGKALASGRWRISPVLLRALPVASSLFIAGLGTFFCIAAYREGRPQLVAILRHLADWME